MFCSKTFVFPKNLSGPAERIFFDFCLDFIRMIIEKEEVPSREKSRGNLFRFELKIREKKREREREKREEKRRGEERREQRERQRQKTDRERESEALFVFKMVKR